MVNTEGLGGLSGTELLIVVGVFILLFGPKKIGELMSGLGGGIKEFKKSLHDEEPEDRA